MPEPTIKYREISEGSEPDQGDVAAIDRKICDALMETGNGDIAAETIP